MNAKTKSATGRRDVIQSVPPLIAAKDLTAIAESLTAATTGEVIALLKRLPTPQRAIAFRLLPKDRAIEVFELLSPRLQGDLIDGLQDSEVATLFAELDPQERVWLLDELPAAIAPRLLQGLSIKERQLTSEVLGYPKGSVGRRMTPEYVSIRGSSSVEEALVRVQGRLDEAEAIYTLPVLDDSRHVIGLVSLRDLLRADADVRVTEIMRGPDVATAYQSVEAAARTCVNRAHHALPIVDNESRLVGMLTLRDAGKILEQEESEDVARQGGVEPLRRPYFATPIGRIVSTRVVWLLVLAIGATLTVQVLSAFEATLAQVTILALFVPLLIGTGGNTGNQAATTITRALALEDVVPRDIWRVLVRELCVGAGLGALLGALGGIVTALVFNTEIGLIIGVTLLAICAMAAAVGGIMPILARSIRVDPAVFSNPFITTFVDASGLIIYFLVARAILGI